jgi:CRP/FNR family transcriptional regulator, cyclic AMP receptor protein
MTSPGILGAFASHAFLNSLSERHRMVLAAGVRPFTAEPTQVLARAGEPANDFFLIQDGHVAIGMTTPDGDGVTMQTVGRGDVIGWSWLVPPHRWKFDCRAVDHVQGLAFNAAWLRDKCEQDHDLGYHLLRQLTTVMASRLEATRRQLKDFYR